MENKSYRQLKITAYIVLILGAAMLVYWGMYYSRGMPLAGIPILSELVNAGLAIISGYGILRPCPWAYRFSIFTAGMWAYGALGGINLVIQNGLDFTSPFGAITDAILFPLILIFAIYLSTVVWKNRVYFL